MIIISPVGIVARERKLAGGQSRQWEDSIENEDDFAHSQAFHGRSYRQVVADKKIEAEGIRESRNRDKR